MRKCSTLSLSLSLSVCVELFTPKNKSQGGRPRQSLTFSTRLYLHTSYGFYFPFFSDVLSFLSDSFGRISSTYIWTICNREYTMGEFRIHSSLENFLSFTKFGLQDYITTIRLLSRIYFNLRSRWEEPSSVTLPKESPAV